MLSGIQPVIYGDGQKVRDYVFVSDVVRANVAALANGTNEIFNIGSGVATKDFEIFEQVRNLLGKTEVQPNYVPRRPGEIDRISLDISKAGRLLDWAPQVPLAEGAQRTVRYFQDAALASSAASNAK
jgi:UDP-glucose 4-epimerase